MTDLSNRLAWLFGREDRPEAELFEARRRSMVATQIAARGVRDPRVLDAVRRVPRERFVPPGLVRKACGDHPLPIGHGQTISQPFIVALMTELAAPGPLDRVLEIGTGSGYQAAVLAELAGEVHTVERIRDLSEGARGILEELGHANVRFHVGDGTLGLPEKAPYDAILVTAGGPRVPDALRGQLAEGGRLVLPVGPPADQRLLRIERRGGEFAVRDLGGCAFVRLYGEDGWEPRDST